MTEILLAVEGLRKSFPAKAEGWFGRSPAQVRAVDGVSFTVGRKETLGLVGESGSGKSTVGKLVLRLIEPSAGSVHFEGADLLAASPRALRSLRPRLQMIFQDPNASLNPRMNVEDIVLETLYAQGQRRSARLSAFAGELLDKVGLPRGSASRHPHEFSGGQRQRIGIARAIASMPKFIVSDEAVSALDVSVQAQVINLLQDLQDDLGISFLFISHDLSVVHHMADRVAVMYLGRIVEIAQKADLFKTPQHPYTRALLASTPVAHPRLRRARERLKGEVPSALEPPSGCHFHPRCPMTTELCRRDDPQLRIVAPGHRAACHFAGSAPVHSPLPFLATA